MPKPIPTLLLLASLFVASEASAFAILRHISYEPCSPLPCRGPVDVEQTLRRAPRWDARLATPTLPGTLLDGLDVRVEAGFGDLLANRNALLASDYEDAVVDAFAAWQTPELDFDIRFDAGLSPEINIFVTDSTHPFFVGNFFSGVADVWDAFRSDRVLTNGQVEAGYAIHSADIYIAVDRVLDAFSFWKIAGVLTEEDRLARFQNLMMHEIGHALGLHHPNDFPDFNFDSDLDPATPVAVNPFEPWDGLMLSPNVDNEAIMQGGLKITEFALLTGQLGADDRAGLDVLYPSIPEPAPLWLGLAAFAFVRCRARGTARD